MLNNREQLLFSYIKKLIEYSGKYLILVWFDYILFF